MAHQVEPLFCYLVYYDRCQPKTAGSLVALLATSKRGPYEAKNDKNRGKKKVPKECNQMIRISRATCTQAANAMQTNLGEQELF